VKISFWSDRAGNGDLYVINPDGSGLSNLTKNSANDGVAGITWSPDRKRIAITRSKSGDKAAELWVMNADGSGQRKVDAKAVRSPQWSPAP